VTAGHVSRVFALKFHPMDRNLVISGGWDNTIQVWDLRCDHAIRSIFGPHGMDTLTLTLTLTLRQCVETVSICTATRC
jgi:WD40 repeat protein